MAQLRWDDVLDGVPCGILVASPAGRIVAANRAAGLVFEDRHGEPGELLLEALREGARPAVAAAFDETCRRGFALRREFVLGLEEGVELPSRVSGSLLRDEGGQAAAVVLVVQDASIDAELARRTLEDQGHADLVAEASHEIRNPMTAVVGTLELLLESGALAGSDRKLADFAHQEARRVVLLVRDILDSSRLEAKAAPLDRTASDVGCIVADAVAGVRGAIPDALVRVSVEPGLPLLHGDREKLDRVVRNLVENALKYSAAGAEVVVCARKVEDVIELSVTDHGIGIPEDELPRVFQKFFRTTTTRRRKIPGYGLGLAMVKTIVEAHGGSISVQSSAGKGSVFTVRLPS